MKKAIINRKGFTLVELLIVIVVIGVLAAMMMFSSTEVVTTAKASNVIANLTHLRKAVLAWYTDNYDRICTSGKYEGMVLAANNNTGDTKDQKYNPVQETNIMDEIAKYLSNGVVLNHGLRQARTEMDEGSYGVWDGGGSGRWPGVNKGRAAWFVGYRLTQSERNKLLPKLQGRASSLGLLFKGKWPNTNMDNNCCVVWLRVW